MRLRVLSALLALALAACTGGGDSTPTRTPTATPEVTAAVPAENPSSPAPTPSPTTTPTLATDPFAAVWLVELASNDVRELYAGDEFPYAPGFDGDNSRVDLRVNDAWTRHYFDDSSEPISADVAQMVESPSGDAVIQPDGNSYVLIVGDREYEISRDGRFSPDGRAVIYSEWSDANETVWLIDIASGVRTRLMAPIPLCGCDWLARSSWSPSGRYWVHATVDGLWLFDSIQRTGTHLIEGRLDADESPSWGTGDVLLAPGSDLTTAVHDLPRATRLDLPDVPWPAAFDESGTLAYNVTENPVATVIFDPSDGSELARWPGEPRDRPLVRGVRNVDSQPAALLEHDPACAGTTVHHPALVSPRCLEGAAAAAWSPDATQIAYARVNGDLGDQRWDIVLHDLATGRETVLGTRTSRFEPPMSRWNDLGTHLLIQWPGPEGL